MKLPKNLRTRLAEEYSVAVDSMRKSPDPAKKIYFFSVFFGEASRILNQAWDPELALIHLVMQTANGQVFTRWDQITKGDRNVELTENFFKSLEAASQTIAEYVRDGENPASMLHGALEKIAELTYFTTGNGYYLFLRGKYAL